MLPLVASEAAAPEVPYLWSLFVDFNISPASPFFMDTSAIISTGVKDDLNLSWLTKLLTQYDIPILEKLRRYSAQEQVIKKLEKELFEQ